MALLMRNYPLRGKTVLITGAGIGIGRAIAQRAHRKGANVVLVGRSPGPLNTLARELSGGRSHVAPADVTDAAQMEAAIASAVGRFGKLDVVVANAGIAPDPATVVAMPPEEFERVLEVNVSGVYRTVHPALPQVIANQGHILLVSSMYSFVNGMLAAPYAMSKAAVEQFGRALRVELAHHGATAGVLYPGWVRTTLSDVVYGDDDLASRMRARGYVGPLGRRVTPEKVARAAVAGMERRAARTIVPLIWVPPALGRGVVQVGLDLALEKDPGMQSMLREHEGDRALKP